MTGNTEKFKSKLKKYRDPKNHNEFVGDGALYVYEVKKLKKENVASYLKLYFRIHEHFNASSHIKIRYENFEKFATRDFLKNRPKSEHEEISKLIKSLTSDLDRKIRFGSFFSILSHSFFKHSVAVITILVGTYLLADGSATWDPQSNGWTFLLVFMLIWAIYTVVTWYKLNKKYELTRSERNKLIYVSTLMVALILAMVKVSPHDPSEGPAEITCYKLANGETECISERQWKRMLKERGVW